MTGREPYVERDGWKDYGDISAVPPWYAVPMECDPCKVKWRGCADVFECPVCGKGTPPWNPLKTEGDGGEVER